MSDASSIRRAFTPLVQPSAVVANGAAVNFGQVPPQTQVGAGFYEGAVRFQLNGAKNYATDSVSGKQRVTGVPFVNTGAQWANLVSETVQVQLAASADEVTQVVMVADRPYNVNAFSEAHVTAATAGSIDLQIVQPPTTATAVLNAGGTAISSFTVTSSSSAYTSVPAVTVSAGNGTGTAVMGLTAIAVTTPGTGYTSAPAVTFSGGAGSGAAATAIIANGSVVGIVVTNPGTGYTSQPTVVLTGNAAATAYLGVVSITVGGTNNNYSGTAPTVSFPAPSGLSALTGTWPATQAVYTAGYPALQPSQYRTQVPAGGLLVLVVSGLTTYAGGVANISIAAA